MSSTVIKWLLTRLLPGVVLCVVLAGAGWWLYTTGYDSGHDSAKADGDALLAREQKARADERQQLAERNQATLQAALDKQAELAEQARMLSLGLDAAQRKLTVTQQQLKKRITHAVQTDGQRFTGLGPDSLRLYRAVLGYTDTGGAGLQNTARGDAEHPADASASGGISPGVLLDHATEYGAWCLTLRNKLEALNAFYTPGNAPHDH